MVKARSIFGATAVAMLVGMTAGCAPLLRGYDGNGIQLFIANDGIDPVSVVVERNGSEHVIGRVEQNAYRSFDLDAAYAGAGMPLLVRVESAHAGFRTDTITAEPGKAIDLRLKSPLRTSRWWYY